MKNYIFYLFLFVAFLGNCQFQTNSNSKLAVEIIPATPQERYGVDYELVDESLIATDNSILNSIDLDRLEYLRHETEDVLFFDKTLNIELRIYSLQKVTQRKRNVNPSIQFKD